MGVADARKHRGDMAVLAVEGQAALGIVPGDRRQSTLDRRDRTLLAAADRRAGRGATGTGGDVEAYGLRVRRQGLQPLPAAPSGKMLPIGGIGFAGVGGTGCLDIIAGLIGQLLQVGGEGCTRFWRRGGEPGIGRRHAGRRLRRGNVTVGRCAERRSRTLLDLNFAVLLDDLAHFLIMTRMNDNGSLSMVRVPIGNRTM